MLLSVRTGRHCNISSKGQLILGAHLSFFENSSFKISLNKYIYQENKVLAVFFIIMLSLDGAGFFSLYGSLIVQ